VLERFGGEPWTTGKEQERYLGVAGVAGVSGVQELQNLRAALVTALWELDNENDNDDETIGEVRSN
jgi:hypothetical protein